MPAGKLLLRIAHLFILPLAFCVPTDRTKLRHFTPCHLFIPKFIHATKLPAYYPPGSRVLVEHVLKLTIPISLFNMDISEDITKVYNEYVALKTIGDSESKDFLNEVSNFYCK